MAARRRGPVARVVAIAVAFVPGPLARRVPCLRRRRSASIEGVDWFDGVEPDELAG